MAVVVLLLAPTAQGGVLVSRRPVAVGTMRTAAKPPRRRRRSTRPGQGRRSARWSAGLVAQRSAANATTAATRLTTDSATSESNPTELVNSQAVVLSPIVTSAAAIDNHSSRTGDHGSWRMRAHTA